MFRKVLLFILALFCVLAAALVIAYTRRDELVMFIAPHLLPADQLRLEHVRGIHVDLQGARVAELALTLASGQQVLLQDAAVSYHFTSYTRAPEIESIDVASVRLLAAPDAANGFDEAAEDAGPGRLSDVMQLLREFPIPHIALQHLDIPQRSEPFVLDLQATTGELALHLESAALLLDARFMQMDMDSAASLQATLENNGATVGSLDLSLLPAGSTFALNGAGQLNIPDLNTLLDALEQSPLSLPLKSVTASWDLAGTVADDIAGTLASAGAGAMNSTTETFVLGLNAGSSLTLGDGFVEGLRELTLHIDDRTEATITTGTTPTFATSSLPLRLSGYWQDSPFMLDAHLALSDCALDTRACDIRFDGSAAWAEYALAGVVEAALPARAFASDEPTAFHVRTEALTLTGLPALAPAFDIDAAVTLDQQSLSFTTPLLLRNGQPDAGIAVDGSYNLDSGSANVQIQIGSMQFSSSAALSAWFNEWPYAFDLLAGTISGDIAARWRPATDDDESEGTLVMDIAATLQDVAGSYEDIFFRGLNLNLLASLDTSAAFPVETALLTATVADVDPGIPLENLILSFQLERATQRLLVPDFRATVLGGTVSGSALEYDFDRERNDVTLRFDGLRLERILELADYDGVEAVGAVSGEIPIAFTAEGVEVQAGTLQADAPGGYIRYLAGAAGTQGNVGLDLVNQALGNYQFDSLVSDINYSADGELMLGMKMQGHNPDMNNGQRINLNLNLTDDIPALLQSLQAARAIEDFLQQQYETATP